ncbi:Electron transfer flavoprotein alpha subunit [Beutenbergia cavernae DSM 12333]|uniref:Electron transfer flavoprotein alpha subunit n=1 Tax=Beutenbergia cavernae (strain ATCC BAA-8 / DSM 12333 / CCUG 43141 / JCM 11478 / NBRC 16432 / NCIMB 13614 / HKI 0122) TaxID=471853 RepID=C5C1Y8_BEUC1|nr:electron transfer flavoprotein subunit alpha/FixB family protein [Beutenbergia cavernae]ACQ79606.1 Electron transfer flavoprotein alpha subunit [Beutenbergia cavernae DSM 12333]
MTDHARADDAVVLVLLDDPAAAPRPTTFELLTLAARVGSPLVVAFGPLGPAATDALGAFGVTDVLQLDVAGEDATLPPAAARALAQAVRGTGATLLLLPSTFLHKETAALAARELGAGLLIDVASLRRAGDGGVVGGKRVFAGTWDTECEVTTPLAVATVRANAVRPEALGAPVGEPAVAVESVDAAGTAHGVTLRAREEVAHGADDGRPALAEATLVVAGGRGTGGDFGPVTELADVLGAAVGATRDVVEEGWIGHDAMVGQTGTTIAPRLYIGAGISGAPHHRGGMQAAETIVAVNIDAEAPLVEIADFAVVGDLASVLTEAAEVIRAHRAASA